METDNLKQEALLELIFCTDSKETEDEIINAVLPAYLRKLNCFMAGILKKSATEILDKQILPYAFKKDSAWKYIKDYIKENQDDNHSGFCELEINQNFYYVYCLSKYGYLVLGRKKKFDLIFKNEFKFVIHFLGKLITQSIEDQRRKEAEIKLAEERQLLRTIIDNIPINIYAKDTNFRKTLANSSELRHLGNIDETEVLGKTDFELYGDDIAKNTLIEDQQVLLDNIPILGEEKQIDNNRWALISKLPLKNEQGETTGLVGISIDYTERKKIQEQLLVFFKLFDNLSDAVQVTTEEGNLFYINKVASERLGIDVDNLSNHKVTDYIGQFKSIDEWKKHVNELKQVDFMTLEGVNINQKTGLKFPSEVIVKYLLVNGKGYILANSRDITDRKKTEAALLENEKKYRILFEGNPQPMWIYDLDTLAFLEVNQTAVDFYGYSKAEFLSMTLKDIRPKSELPDFLDSIERAKSTENSIEESLHIKKNGEHIYVEVTAHSIVYGNKTARHILINDITKRKKAEEKLRWNQSLMQLMSNSSPLGFLVVDNRTDAILYFNHQFCQIWGIEQLADAMKRGEYKNNDLIPYCLPILTDVDSFKKSCEPLQFEDNRVAVEDEISFVGGRTIHRFSTQIRGENDEYYGRFYIFEDITKRKQAEIELQSNEKKYRQITDNMLDIVWTTDLHFNLKFLSPSAERLYGEPIENQLKRPVNEKFAPASLEMMMKQFALEMAKENDPLADKNRTLKMEVEHFRADMSTFWAEINMSILRDEFGNANGIQGVTREITERKKAETELRVSEERKASLIASMSDFVFVLDNDLVLIEYHIPLGTRLFFNPKKYIGRSFSKMYIQQPTKTTIEEALKLCIKRSGFSKTEFYFEVPTGKLWFDLHATVLNQHGRQAGVTCVVRDITERKKTEEALVYNESILKSFFELSPIGIALNDFETGQFINVNEAMLKPTGYSREELLQLNFMDITAPEKIEEEKERISKIKDIGNFGPLEKEYICKDGSRYPVLIRGTIVEDSLGQKMYWSVVEDISERKKAEETIRQQLKMQELLIRISTVYINTDLKKVGDTIQKSLEELGEFVGADRAYIFDYDFSENNTSNTYEWCSEGVIPEKDELQNVPLDNLPYFLGKHRKGEELCIENVALLPDEGPDGIRAKLEPQGIKSLISIPMISSGKLLGFVGFDSIKLVHSYSAKEKKLLEVFSQMLVNVTERIRSGTLLMLQEEKYRNIISNMNLGIIEVDKEENIVFANQSFSNISGYSIDELLSMKATAFLQTKEDLDILETKQQTREKGISDGYELAVKNKQGEPRWWFISGAPNYNDSNELIGSIGIHLDITDQKKLEKELEQAIITAEFAAKSKEIFLANMSHEIRTPLNVITGMVRQLSKEDLNEKQRSYVNHSETAAEHLLTIINNILDMSKIESGEFELDNHDFSVSSVVSDVRSILFSKAREKNLEFRIDLSTDTSKAHIGDAGRLRQILINLVGNSIKFTENGYVSLAVSILHTTSNYQTVKFIVSDSGIGMSEGFMHRLFDKFSQEDGASNRRFEGTGLGMSISKELVQLMGGEIQVQSQKGKGTQISFEVKLAIGNEVKLVKKGAVVDKNSFIGLKVLLVEDNDMNRFIAIQSLKHVGCEITEAINGIDAIEKMKKNNFDIILMDIQMPLLDGVEATKQIRSTINANIPIIALTANAFKHDIDLYLSVGMNDYLIKPYKENQLFEKIALYATRITENSEIENSEDLKEPLFDVSQLRELSRGDESFVLKMLSVFVTLAEQTISQMNESMKLDDVISVQKVAHKIKPSLDNLRIMKTLDNIRKLEKFNSDESSLDDFKQIVSEVTTVLQLVIDEIRLKYES